MSLLFARSASLPDTRHELFNTYFSTIYDREKNKGDTYLTSLLQRHRRSVEYVHQRAGLALQQKAEVVGQADALLSIEQFNAMIRERLIDDEEFSTNDSERITGHFMEAALLRLVLLVPRLSEHVGYELRSLQEFMAAAYFFRHGEQGVLEPLEATALSTHWRHTWLLAAGRLFDAHEVLRGDLVSLVDDVGLASQVTRAAGMGPLLAMDLIADGIAAQSPKYLRRLVRIMLQMLELPPGDHTSRLNQMLLDAAEKDQDTWSLIRDKLVSPGALHNRISVVALHADWGHSRSGICAAFSRRQISNLLPTFAEDSAAALLIFLEGRPEQSALGSWSRKSLVSLETTNLSIAIRPYLKLAGSVTSPQAKKLLRASKAIAVEIIGMETTRARRVMHDSELVRFELLEVLVNDYETSELLALSLSHFDVTDSALSDYLRVLLRRAVERSRPRWAAQWRDPFVEA